jgi:hypothetical protein
MLTYFNYIIFNNKQQNKQIDFVHSTVTNCNPHKLLYYLDYYQIALKFGFWFCCPSSF